MSTDTKKPAHQQIETMLNLLKDARTRIDMQIEYLIESVGHDEDEYTDLKNEVVKLYMLNTVMKDYIATTLDNNFDSAETKKQLLNMKLLGILGKSTDDKSALELFVQEYLS